MFLSQQVERNEVVANKNGKSELTDDFPKGVRLKKISKLHAIKGYCPVFSPKMKIL